MASERRAVARGECPACNRRHKLVKDGTLGSHFLSGGDTYCTGIGDVPLEGTVRWYGAEIVGEESSLIGPRAALALVAFVILFSFFFGVGVVIVR